MFVISFAEDPLSKWDRTVFESSLKSTEFKISTVTFLMNSVPILIDLCMDLYSGVDEKLFHFTVGRTLITIAAVLCGSQFASQSFSLDTFQVFTDDTSSFLFTIACFNIILSNSILFCICQANPKICTVLQTTGVGIVTSLTFLVRYYCLLANSHLVHLSYFFAYVLLFSIPFVIMYWLYLLFMKKKWNTDNYSCILYLSVLIIFYTATYFNIFSRQFEAGRFGSSAGSNAKSNTRVFLAIYFFSFIMILLAMVPVRIAKIDALASKV